VPEDFEDPDLHRRLHEEAHARLRRYALACKRDRLSALDVALRLAVLATSAGITVLVLYALWRLVK
jgi:hypothetical protein